MASLWRQPNTNMWTACFTDRNGRRLKKATGIEVVARKQTGKPSELRQKAQAIANEFEVTARGLRTVNKVREVLFALQAEMAGTEVVTMTVEKAVNEWIARRQVETSEATMKFYRHFTGKLVKFLGSRANHDIALVTRQDIFNYRASRLKLVSSATVNHEVKGLRMFFKAARLEGWMPENPAEGIDNAKPQKGEEKETRRDFTEEEIKSVLGVASDEWKSLIMHGLYTLQRLGDLCRLPWKGKDNWSGVFLETGIIRLITGKTGKKMTIPIAKPLRELLEQRRLAMPDAELVHPVLGALIEGSTGPVSQQFAKLLVSAGLRVEKEKLKGNRRVGYELSFHCLRHAGISMLKTAGIPASVVMELAGHSSVQMSHHYTHTSEAALLEAVNALPKLVGSTTPPAPAPPAAAAS